MPEYFVPPPIRPLPPLGPMDLSWVAEYVAGVSEENGVRIGTINLVFHGVPYRYPDEAEELQRAVSKARGALYS